MTLGARVLKSIALTTGSMLLFGLVTSVYYAISAQLSGTLSMEAAAGILRNSAFLTVTLFGALLYFPIQVIVLLVGKFIRFLLFFLPALAAFSAVAVTLYYLKIASPEARPIDDSFLLEYLRLGIVGFVFVVLNNLLFVRVKR